MDDPVKETPITKPGILTTEFWLTVIVVLGGQLSTVYSDKPWAQALGHVASALAVMGYGVSRAMTKKAAL